MALWDEALNGRELLDYAVESLRSEKAEARGLDVPRVGDGWESEVVVRRLGGLSVPVEIEVQFEGGARVLERWDGKEPWLRLRYTRAERLRGVQVDPRRLLWLEQKVGNNVRLLERDERRPVQLIGKVLLWLQHVLAFAGGAA